MSDNRSNGSHSPFRPTRLSPPGYDPYAEYDDPALEFEQEADAETLERWLDGIYETQKRLEGLLL